MDLRQLGLSDYEEKAYKALIKLGKSSASEISVEGGVSYGKIYEVLSSLERKGFVKVIPDKTKLFVAADPKNILPIITQKEAELQKLKEEVGKMRQEYDYHEEEVVEIAKGKMNFYKLAREIPESKQFSYNLKYTSEVNPEFVRSVETMNRRKIPYKVLTRYNPETKKNIEEWFKTTKNIRQIENSGIALGINESGVLIALINKNTTMVIKDKAFIEIMKKMFEETYKNSKEIKN